MREGFDPNLSSETISRSDGQRDRETSSRRVSRIPSIDDRRDDSRSRPDETKPVHIVFGRTSCKEKASLPSQRHCPRSDQIDIESKTSHSRETNEVFVVSRAQADGLAYGRVRRARWLEEFSGHVTSLGW